MLLAWSGELIRENYSKAYDSAILAYLARIGYSRGIIY